MFIGRTVPSSLLVPSPNGSFGGCFQKVLKSLPSLVSSARDGGPHQVPPRVVNDNLGLFSLVVETLSLPASSPTRLSPPVPNTRQLSVVEQRLGQFVRSRSCRFTIGGKPHPAPKRDGTTSQPIGKCDAGVEFAMIG